MAAHLLSVLTIVYHKSEPGRKFFCFLALKMGCCQPPADGFHYIHSHAVARLLVKLGVGLKVSRAGESSGLGESFTESSDS